MIPRLTASSTSNGGTMVPAADISHLRRPPDISSTILASSRADTWSRLVAGHVLCIFQTIFCCAAASPGPLHSTAARIRTGRAKAIQTRAMVRGFMGRPPFTWSLASRGSLAEEIAGEPERDLGEHDAQAEADELEDHELTHPVVDVAERPL